MSPFRTEPLIFAPGKNLEAEYSEELYVERDEELQEYVALLEPVLLGRSPTDIYIHGARGSGKTSTTKYVLSLLDQEMEDLNRVLTTAYVSASNGSSSYQALIKIVNSLREPRGEELLPESGPSRDQVKRCLIDELKELKGVVYFVVDEVDGVSDPDILFNDLSRINEVAELPEVDIGIITIANDANLLDELEPKTASTFKPTQVVFPTYNADDIMEILRRHSEVAFRDEVLPENIIPLCASLCKQMGGDVRDGISLLATAGEIARRRIRLSEMEDIVSQKITESDVRQAEKELLPVRFKKTVQNLSTVEQRILFIVTGKEAVGEAPVKTSEVTNSYGDFFKEYNQLSGRQLRTYLNSLSEQGLLHKKDKNNGRSSENGGQYYEFGLAPSLGIVDALELLSESNIHGGDTDEIIIEVRDLAIQNNQMSEGEKQGILSD